MVDHDRLFKQLLSASAFFVEFRELFASDLAGDVEAGVSPPRHSAAAFDGVEWS